MTPAQIRAANRTARAAGAVGAKAITPRYVAGIVFPGETVLNFGAGKPDRTTGLYLHSEMLRAAGAKVWEYDFGDNATAHSLGYQYDIVMASNVLNVQANRPMMKRTLQEIMMSLKPHGIAVMNYPDSPRYSDMEALDVEHLILGVFKRKAKKVGGTNKAPLWVVEM